MMEIVEIKDETKEKIKEFSENKEREDWRECFLRTFLANH